MSLQHIRTAIDHARPTLGDVIIAKHTIFDPKAKGHRLLTKCSRCGELFPTEFRRMGRVGTARGCEVRSIPQCKECRSRYPKTKIAVQPELPLRPAGEFRVGDMVRVIEHYESIAGASAGDIVEVREVSGANRPDGPFLHVKAANGTVSGGHFVHRFELVKGVA